MNRQKMFQRIAGRTGLEQRVVKEVANQFLVEIETAVVENRSLQIRSFGTFILKRRQAKMGRNPFTNEPVPVPTHLTVVFKPAPRLKKRVNQSPSA